MLTHWELAAIYFGMAAFLLGLQHVINFRRTFK
jgi:hypothetical protein